ncbi:hypothetical protein MCOR25_010639 [Pyricularia grisea]|uniref:Kinetochore protein mis13 n=1 Tax=Pyricularia grisea TaxID=148305 RepID=A0A6P8BCP0_PYRGI|nr:uncharacterized protein PgNI_03346 [Pyricularia grisea]KAI6349775.1 hypothetical protein MCOR25_010639 [Pyricularia grisea]TLD13585.1 hypothetical protein PgNI_03346 [Pyricularia grisea]
MTTLIRARQPLQDLSMSNQPGEPRRYSKRLADAAVYDEQDGDFLFTRGSKRARTSTAASDLDAAAPSTIAAAPAVKKAAGRPAKKAAPVAIVGGRKRAASPQLAPVEETEPPATKRPTRRKPSASPAPAPEPKPLAVPKTRARRTDAAATAPPSTAAPTTGRRTRSSMETVVENGAGNHHTGPEPEIPAATTAPEARKPGRGRPPTKKRTAAVENRALEPVATPRNDAMDTSMDDGPAGEGVIYGQEHHEPARKIALPFSDTPIMDRNKELRKKGGAGGSGARRSSLGMRGRRASSLIESGHSAIPHREVNAGEFYKHIESDVMETRRMKQLLTWCGERALLDRPAHGSLDSMNSNAILGARAIQDQLLKDFGNKSEFSDWFSREDEASEAEPKRPVITKPNPVNIENEKKIVELEATIKRLKLERKKWLALEKPPPEFPPLFEDEDPTKAPLPDEGALDEEEARMLRSLTEPTSNFASLRAKTQSRLQSLMAPLEVDIDKLADSVHKLDRRVAAGGRQADRVLGLSADRLKEREEREKAAAGTKNLPVMEVLRSLGKILPEEDG